MTGGKLRGWPVKERKERKKRGVKRSKSKKMVNRTSPSEGLCQLIGSDRSKEREVKFIYNLQ